MSERRQIEIFSAGCPLCRDAIELVNDMACSSCEIIIHDMKDAAGAARANALGIRALPAIAVDGRLVDCCASQGPDATALRALGIGQSLT